MASAWVKVAINLVGNWRLPSDSPGMLFRFRTGAEEETIVEGRLKTLGDADITPGNVYEGGLFIEGKHGESLLEPTISWCGTSTMLAGVRFSSVCDAAPRITRECHGRLGGFACLAAANSQFRYTDATR